MSEFEELVADFERLVDRSAAVSGNELRATRREMTRVEKLIASLAETGMLSYSDTYADCRDIGHQWEERFSDWEGNECIRLHVCERCTAERLDAYSRTGAVVSRRYSYPDGYEMTDEEMRDIGGTRRRYWRAVNVQRTISS